MLAVWATFDNEEDWARACDKPGQPYGGNNAKNWECVVSSLDGRTARYGGKGSVHYETIT